MSAPTRYPAPPEDAVSIELQVPFHDVDVLEVAWHGHYAKYLELARTAWMRARSLDAADMRALGFRFFVTEYFLRHLAPLRYGDQVQVQAWPVEVQNRIRIAYRVQNRTTGRIAAQGWTVLVSTDAAGELFLQTPEPILARLRAPGPGSAAQVDREAA